MAIKVLKRREKRFKAAPVKKSKRERRERDRDGIRIASVEKLEAKELDCSMLGKRKDRPEGRRIALVSNRIEPSGYRPSKGNVSWPERSGNKAKLLLGNP